MNDKSLRMALEKLLAQGDAMDDRNMMKAHGPKAPTPEMCPECKEPLEDGKCAKCGYSAEPDESGLAESLEQAAAEG